MDSRNADFKTLVESAASELVKNGAFKVEGLDLKLKDASNYHKMSKRDLKVLLMDELGRKLGRVLPKKKVHRCLPKKKVQCRKAEEILVKPMFDQEESSVSQN